MSYQFPSSGGRSASVEQRVGEPVDARNAGERIVDRGRQRADRDLDDLRDAELAILGERAVAADVNSSINRGFERADACLLGRLLRAARRAARTGPDGT